MSKVVHRIFGVSRHQLLLAGLKQLISDSPNSMRWVGSHPPDPLVFREIERLNPHVIIFDDRTFLTFPEAPSQWAKQKIGAVFITQVDDCQKMEHLFQHQILAIVQDSEPPGSLLGAISSVINHRLWIPVNFRDHLISRSIHEFCLSNKNKLVSSPPQPILSPKERELIKLVIEHPDAKSLKLADWMGVSESTIRNRLSRIYTKLNIHGRAALVKYAHQQRSSSML